MGVCDLPILETEGIISDTGATVGTVCGMTGGMAGAAADTV